jgi:hypothetical protein
VRNQYSLNQASPYNNKAATRDSGYAATDYNVNPATQYIDRRPVVTTQRSRPFHDRMARHFTSVASSYNEKRPHMAASRVAAP